MRFLPYLVVALVACGRALRPDGDGQPQGEAGSSGTASRDAGGVGGGGDCTTSVNPALWVTFSGQPTACDKLSVVATDGAFTEPLECMEYAVPNPCVCFGPDERPGTYEITVTTGEPPTELGRSGPILVGQGSCHVDTRAVVVQLSRPPSDAGGSDAADASDARPAEPSDGGF